MKIIKKILLASLFLAVSSFASQELVRGNGAEPATLDPTLITGVPGNSIARDLFETLMTTDRDGNIIPGQAESYTVSNDKLIYTFKIRKNAKWSNGDDVTAHDFEYTFKRAVDPKTAAEYAWYFEILGMKNGTDIIAGKKTSDTLGVKAIDDKTLQITLDKPIPYFLIGLSHSTMSPVPKKVIQKYGKNWTKPKNIVSNGAYKLKTWIVNEKIVLVKNENYYNKNSVKINKVTFLPIETISDEYNRYKAGEVDIMSELPEKHFKYLMKNTPDEVKIMGLVGTYYYYLNMKKKPFDDVRVRKALAYAINRDIITKKVTGTGQIPAYTFVPNITSHYTAPIPTYQTWTQKQREQKALELMNEAGINKNNPLKFELLYNTSESHKKIALAISSMWKKVFKGAVTVTLKNQEWKTYLEEKKAGNYQVARAGWVGDYNEASTMLDLLTKGHSSNDSFYDNPKYDKLMNEARVTLDDTKRNKLYQAVDLIITEDMPVIPIYQYTSTTLVKPNVGGYPKSNPLNLVYTRLLYIKK